MIPFEGYINKHQAIILLFGGILATAVSVTVFAYTNFSTKQEVNAIKTDIKDDIKEIKQDIKTLLKRGKDE